jgi:hypothetical protein
MAVTITATGPTALRTYVFPDSNATMLTSAAAVTPAQGGTGIASYAVGDLIYASAGTTLAKLADVAVGQVLVSGGVGVAPAWSANPTLTTLTTGNGTAALPSLHGASANTGFYFASGTLPTVSVGGTAQQNWYDGGSQLLSTTMLAWATVLGGANDTGFTRTAPAVLALGNGTNADATGRLNLGVLAVGTNPAASGSVRIPAGGGVSARNDANTGDVLLISQQASDRIFLGGGGNFQISIDPGTNDILWAKPLVALGGGAAPTFGTIGGSGPTVAAQNTWLRMKDSAGAIIWLPVWK